MSEALLGTPVPGRRIVASDPRGSWKAAVPFLPLIVLAAVNVPLAWDESYRGGYDLFFVALFLVWLLAACIRAGNWYWCGDDSLWDGGEHLLWARGGRVVSCVAWEDVVSVDMDLGVRFPALYWGPGDRRPSRALPRVHVSARARPQSTRHDFIESGDVWFGQFASLVLTNRQAAVRAKAELDRAVSARVRPAPQRPRTIAEVMAARSGTGREGAADES